MAQLRGDEKRRYVAEMFARISPRYDLMNSLMTGGMHHRWKRATARFTRGRAARERTGYCDRYRRPGIRTGTDTRRIAGGRGRPAARNADHRAE